MSKDTNSQAYLDLKTELRSILISSKLGCSQEQLEKDYYNFNRRNIPYDEIYHHSAC